MIASSEFNQREFNQSKLNQPEFNQPEFNQSPISDFDLEDSLSQIDLPVDWIGLRHVQETTTTRHYRDRQSQANGRRDSTGVMVEVLVNGQFGYASTNNPNQIGQAVNQAYRQAIAASKFAIHQFTVAQRPVAIGDLQFNSKSNLKSNSQNQQIISSAEVNDLLKQICEHLQVSDRIVQTSAYVQNTKSHTHFVSSNGSNIRQEFETIATDYAATAQDGNIIQRRSDRGQMARCQQAGLEVLQAADLLERVRQVGLEAVELLYAEECPNITTDLLLSPDQMLLQIHESVGHPLELDRILGDERNYAGSSFVRLADFGKLEYGSELMNITFDPHAPGEYASYGFDDLGMKAEREYIIQNGKLLRGLGSLESQARSHISGTASARSCSWNRPPIDRMANLNLEAGTDSFAEMINSIEYGVFMQSNRSWSIDDYRLKFQFGCEYAQLIEDGRITKTLRNPNYRGITTDFWHGLKRIGDRATVGVFGSPFCGKGEPNQTIRVGHASPVCLFNQVEIFGGAL
jgi:predicted Zn-dependent protease